MFLELGREDKLSLYAYVTTSEAPIAASSNNNNNGVGLWRPSCHQ